MTKVTSDIQQLICVIEINVMVANSNTANLTASDVSYARKEYRDVALMQSISLSNYVEVGHTVFWDKNMNVLQKTCLACTNELLNCFS